MGKTLFKTLIFFSLIFVSWNFYAHTLENSFRKLIPQIPNVEIQTENSHVATLSYIDSNLKVLRIGEVMACDITLDSGSENQEVCEGSPIEQIDFSVNSGIISVSNLPSGLIVSGNGTSSISISGIPIESKTYFVIASGGSCNGTGNEIQIGTITVTTSPSAGTLSGDQAICEAGTTTFASTVAGGTWSSDNISVATVDPVSGDITGIAAGTATITYTVAGTGGCADATETRD
ncbi:Ig-like domain-containing protein, partial [Algoriphagus sp.]|uniref:Ig-like domain-containing protein n=1 Tax=Algoriphagus sp. TaxID=1872435 RepID=UPI0025E30E99